MKCRNCKRTLPENAVFCCWCGEKQIKERKKKDTISVPTAIQRSGSWNIYLRAEGISVTEATQSLCEAKARAIRAGFLEKKKNAPKISLHDAETKYIKNRTAVLSPSTIRGYNMISEHRFQRVRDVEIASIKWQEEINEEALKCSSKTLHNAWGFIASVLRENSLDVPNVSLPQIVKKDEPWLDYIQIQKFLQAVNGKECELPALLALHGLRCSELLNVSASKINRTENKIVVEGSVVRGINGLVTKETNKNQSSHRTVPIMIPRLLELAPENAEDDEKPLVNILPNTLYSRINSVCRQADLPLVGVHGLRRSFASLCYHLGVDMITTMRLGGWSDDKICKEIYIKLSEKDINQDVEKLREFYKF